ncbi:ankyrin-1-like [Symsagittifera roscoffensis]|uniref:ankyrin-1-like n=1 Tax=Symsagittifera roscoffensis TaxID=84072 RepID=UPI00307B7239
MPENSEVSPDPWTAAKSGDFDKIQDYIQKQGDPNAKNDDGFTLLHKACVGGQVRVAKFLLDNGASVNGVTKKGSMPIHVGGRAGHVEIVKLLIDYGASIDSRTTDCWTVLHESCDNNKIDMVNFLLRQNAKVNTINEKGNTPLHAACEKGNLEIVKILLEHGAEKDAENVDGFTPLLRACTNGHLFVIKELASRGANIYKTTKKGSTAMHLAARDGSKEVLQFLITNGFDKDVRTPDLWTPLHEAADTNHPEVLEYLLREKANINAQTQAENTPLHLAVKRKKLDAAHRLLNASPAPDVTIKAKGKTPLQMARDSNLDQALITKIEKLEQKILAQRNQTTAVSDNADGMRNLSINDPVETDVFLSYDYQNQANVNTLCDCLEKNYRVWFDKKYLTAGDKINEQIELAIQNCKLMIVCLTPAYLRSKALCKQMQYANEQGKKLIGLRFSSSAINSQNQDPQVSQLLMNMVSIKVMDLTHGETMDERTYKSLQGHVDKLLDAEH